MEELTALSRGLLKLHPNESLTRQLDTLRTDCLRGNAAATDQLAYVRGLHAYAKRKNATTYVEKLNTLQLAMATALRHEYDRIVPESGCGCAMPRPMFNLDGTPLCQCCGRFLPEETKMSSGRARNSDPHRSQIEYFDALLDNLEGLETCLFEPVHMERLRGTIRRELNPARPGWIIFLTAGYLRDKLKNEQLPQYYPHLIKLYRELVGELPYQQPAGFRADMRNAFRVLLEVQEKQNINMRRSYPFIIHNLLKTLYPNDMEIEKLRTFHQFDERSISAEQARQWSEIREAFLKQLRLSSVS